MEIDDTGVGFNLGEASDNDSGDTGTSRNIVVDLQDFIGVNKWHGRCKYKDTCTWKQHIQQFNDAWASIINELVDNPNSWDFSIQVIDVYSPTRKTTIYRDSETKATSALVQAGYLPASPESPSIVPNFSIEAFAKTLEGKPPQIFSRMVVVDGNNSLKRLDGVGKHEVSDTCVFGESDYYLSEEFVNLYADEVPAHPQSKPVGEVTEEDFSQDWVNEEHGDPTGGDPDPTLQECTDNWKASDTEAAKKMWDAFWESGYFVMACRHGFVIAKYPLSMVAKALKVFSPGWVLGYDIGCSFSGTIRQSSPGQWDREKYQNLATMLHNNYVQTLNILEYELPSFEADIQALGLTKEELSTYIAEESRHYATLGSETEEDLHAVAYVELLQKYSEVNTAYENTSTNFCLHTPSDYQFLSDATSYNVNLSEGCKTETRHRYLLEQQDKILFETVQLEAVMNIDRRWEPSDREYKDAVGYINPCKYRQALERLHKLVVQRLFELHKMNLSNTALDPPRDTLDWSKVSHFTFLDQFNILQDTWHSVFDQPWAKPVIQMVDEEKKFDITLQTLENSPTFGPVSDYVERRKAVNSLLLARINQTYNLPGFTGNRTPGRHEDDNEFIEGVGAMVDFMSGKSWAPSTPKSKEMKDILDEYFHCEAESEDEDALKEHDCEDTDTDLLCHQRS
ncbi:hypothetical protein BDP27DRAFT_1361685 [Rhodocollybia butyracea]|uniref:Uncharacterized protein n=1 Tax=Rhodocollybia butyracea TaxID=206335 RepID=A0A9P5PX20_9AGAR|nr:hypothetical protein BDP27DRAFT_1361685 [Rhodocollybia butyracea]